MKWYWFAALFSLGLMLSSGAPMSAQETAAAPLATIRYQLDDKLMCIPVRVNGSAPARFCIDSGARHSVIDPRLAAQLGLGTVAKGHTTGTGKGDVPLATLEPVTLDVGGAHVQVDAPWSIDLSPVPIARNTRGLLGFDAFDQYVLRFDPIKRTVAFFNRARFTPSASGTVLPMIVQDRAMYLDAKLDVKPGLSVTHRLRIDTGSNDAVNDEIVGQALVTRKTNLGRGLGASFAGLSGVFDAVQIGPYQIRHVWGPGGPGPAVGMEIFRRFVSTFDVRRGRLYLSPTPGFLDPVPPPGK